MSLKEQLNEIKAMSIAKHPKEAVDLVLGQPLSTLKKRHNVPIVIK